jgi:hypothetical protein
MSAMAACEVNARDGKLPSGPREVVFSVHLAFTNHSLSAAREPQHDALACTGGHGTDP